MSDTRDNDPLGYVDELRTVLAAAPLTTGNASPAEVGQAAYLALRNIGYCQLYGITLPPELQPAFPGSTVVAAIDDFLCLLLAATSNAKQLPSDFDWADPDEAVDCCTSVLHDRMEVWAAFIGIQAVYKSARKREPALRDLLSFRMCQLWHTIKSLDDVLQQPEQMQLLSAATERPLLDNWRKMLAGKYRKLPPWWLDGTLEQLAAGMGDQIDKLAAECGLAKQQQKCSSDDSTTA